ncbi:unnamed protein product, partial [Echinostoma caproni]|uniref:Protein kinase domain-containing protein n=1 Tax=Echinostoma caproni TaxID=27848 RepID=A0A183AVL5_9TREM
MAARNKHPEKAEVRALIGGSEYGEIAGPRGIGVASWGEMTTDAKFPVPVAEFRLVADVATEEVIDGVDDDVPLEIVTL